MTTYTTYGSVRGGCGHKHRTIETACRCAQKDQRDCKSVRGYSDRSVWAVVDGHRERLSEGDYAAVVDTMDRLANA